MTTPSTPHARMVPADQPEAWPFAPGDVVRDSGEDGDDAEWLLAAPEGTVVIDLDGRRWVQGVGLWLETGTDAKFVDLPYLPAQVLAQRGPLTVEAVPVPRAARPAAPSTSATPPASVGTSGVGAGAPGGAGEVGLGDEIRGLGTHASVPDEYVDALADRADALELRLAAVRDAHAEHRRTLTHDGKRMERIDTCHCLGCVMYRAAGGPQ